MRQKEIVKYGLGLALLIAIFSGLAPLIPALEGLKQFLWIGVVAALVAGYTVKTTDVKLLLAAIVIVSFTTVLAVLPTFGEILQGIFANVGTVAGAFALPMAVREIAKRIR